MARDPKDECARYERTIVAAGGLGLTFLGLGSNGHIAFNEPGTPFDSRTRVVELTPSTRKANAPLFAGDRESVKRAYALSGALVKSLVERHGSGLPRALLSRLAPGALSK